MSGPICICTAVGALDRCCFVWPITNSELLLVDDERKNSKFTMATRKKKFFFPTVEQFVFVEATLIIQFAVAVGLWHCSQSSVCCKTRYLSPIVCGYRAVTQHEEKLRHKNKEDIFYTISQKKSSNNVQCELEGKVTTWFIQFFGLILNVRAHALFFPAAET